MNAAVKENAKVTTQQKARIGDVVRFIRKDKTFTGTVITIRENSVIVELSPKMGMLLGYDNNLTVVSHRNYLIIDSSKFLK
ncbi:DUF2187 family protein [Heyndrickxia acidicola]|uniref:DUF2187 family protein n=1 Tax=Heyndrickxia acidicola TaxID=209389 RepID=A0ABU6MAE0_9BACI|nr:DUF2187 family protein [Heyndrickxia acidicola]MED1201641.1 DUF2187 family protein [Heyndrickxia acidicola]